MALKLWFQIKHVCKYGATGAEDQQTASVTFSYSLKSTTKQVKTEYIFPIGVLPNEYNNRSNYDCVIEVWTLRWLYLTDGRIL